MKNSDKKVLLTKEGLEKLKKEYERLVNIKRPEVVARVARAREFGDLTENAEYAAAREELELVDGQITDLKQTLKEAQVVTTNNKTDFVTIGSTVVVEADGVVDEFTIVGSLEANPLQKKISNESPVGKALLGTKVGEVAEVATPIVKYKYKILKIK